MPAPIPRYAHATAAAINMADDFIAQAKSVLQTEIDELVSLADRIGPEFSEAVQTLREGLAQRGKIIVIGVGKSENIATKIAATLVAARAQYPNAEIWVVVRKGTEGILAGCPAIDHLLTVAPNENNQRGPESLWRDLRTLMHLRRQHFDYAFELSDGDRGR